MKLLLLLAALVAPVHAAQEAVFPLPLFRDGLYTRYSANAIPDGGLAEALNVLIDQDVDGVVVARNGYAKYNTSAITDTKTVRGLWAFDASDGTKYMVALSSMSFYYTTGDGSWTQITGLTGFSATKDFDCVQTIGKLFCGNSDVVFSWDGTSTATVTGAPLGNLLGRFRNRLLIAGVSGSKARLRGSGELDATDWTLQIPGVSTTPFNLAFGGADDGEDITCLMGAFQDVFIVGKRNSLWGLYGFGRTDFQIREISREVGCIEQRSVREKNNCLYWMSQRGIEKFCGAVIERIGDPIRDNIDNIVAAAGNTRSALDTTQSDFEAGNLSASGPGSPLSATIFPGTVVPTTFTVTDSTFDSGMSTLSRVSGGTLQLTPMLSNAGFETGDFTNWTMSGGFVIGASGSCLGTYEAKVLQTAWVSGSGAIQVLDGSDDSIIFSQARTTPGIGQSSCASLTLDISTMTASTIKVRITDGTNILTTTAFQKPAGVLVLQFRRDTAPAASSYMRFDFPEPFYASSGTYLSNTFNVGQSTPVWGQFSTTYTFISDYGSASSRSSVRFETQVATSPSGVWTTTVTASDTAIITSEKRQFIRYLVTMESPNHLGTPTINAVGLSAAATGYFIGQCRNTTNMSSWGLLSCNTVTSGGGFITLAVATGTSCNMATRSTATYTAVANNTTISVATAAFVSYRALFDFDAATQAISNNLALQDCTINWTEGSARPPVAAQVYRDRYYLAYTSSTASGSYNSHLLVLDKNDKWTIFDNHPCYSLAFYNRKLYCGSSTDAGRVWLLDQGTDDDGAAIFSKVRTKAFHLGLPESRKKFKKLYLDLEPSPSQSITLTARYTLERSSPTYSLSTVDLNEDPGSILTPKFPFTLTNPVTGRYIQLELESSALNSPWRLFGGRLYYSPLPPE